MINNMNTKKNIFIGGVARAGKSTIAEKLSKNSIYNHFPVDYIATSLHKNFPHCGINDRVIIDNGSHYCRFSKTTFYIFHTFYINLKYFYSLSHF